MSLSLVGFGWLGMARLVRGQVLSLKQTPFVERRARRRKHAPRSSSFTCCLMSSALLFQRLDGYGRAHSTE